MTNSRSEVPGISRECDRRFVIGRRPTEERENLRSRPGRTTLTFLATCVSEPSARSPTDPYSSFRSNTTE